MADSTRELPPRKPRRWARRFVILAMLLIGLAWFAPAIAAKTGILNGAIAKATAKLNGTLTVGATSLGWLSGVELRDVELKDAEGRTILTAPKIYTSHSLLSLAQNQADLGTFTIDNPKIEIVCEKQSTNLEKTIAKYLVDESEPSASRLAVAIKVINGTISLRDADENQTWTLANVEVNVDLPRDTSAPIVARFRGETSGTKSAGKIDAEVSMGKGINAKLKSENFPMEFAAPFVKRFVDKTTNVVGRLTSDMAVTIEGSSQIKASGTLAIADLDIRSAQLGDEHLKLQKLELPLAMETTPNGVRIDRAELTCDLGKATISGTFDPDELLAKWLERPGLSATADLDLARVAAMFPKLIRMKEGTEIREGRVSAKLASKTDGTATSWTGTLFTSAIRGVRNGKPLDWDKPLDLNFTGKLGADGYPIFEGLFAKSEFASLSSSGSVSLFHINGDVSLDKLSLRLAEFIDLQGVTFGGTATLVSSNRTAANGVSSLKGTIILKNFVYADATTQFREPDLNLEFAGTGLFFPTNATVTPLRLDAGQIKATAVQDTLQLTLLEPIFDLRTLQTGKATAKLTGDLLRWRSRIGSFAKIPKSMEIGGNGTISVASMQFDAAKLNLQGTEADLANARFYGYGIKADEPQLKIFPTNIVFDRASGTIDIPLLQASSQTVAVGAKEMKFQPAADGSYLIGFTAVATANLGRLQKTLQLQSDPKGSDLIAGFTQNAEVNFKTTTDGKYLFKTKLPLTDFVYGLPAKPTWSEAKATVALDGEYDPNADSLKFDSAKIDRPDGLAVQASGSLGKLSSDLDIDLAGKLTYDLATLEPQLKNYLGKSVRAVGKDTRDFRLKGSLGAPNAMLVSMNGNAGLAWQSLKAYGFDVGQGELKATLDRGILKVDPLEATFGQTGKVRIEPTVSFVGPTSVLTLAKGKIIDRAKLTPAACAEALGYALPVLAQSTETEGNISFDLEENRIPLDNLDGMSLKGKLTLHSVQVGAGPMVTEIVTMLGGKQTKLTVANEQVVPIRVENGRVYHENLTITTSGFTMTTSGSVGLNGTVSMVADLPIPESMIGPLLRGTPKLKDAIMKKRIQIPIGGTIGKPQLDQRAFFAASKKFIEEVGKDAVKNKVGDLLNGFLPMPKNP